MNKIVMRAYAKINISLDILGRLENGYHDMKMVMQTVGMYDSVAVSKSDKITVKTNLPFLPVDESNHAYKAAKLFFEETGIEGGAAINIYKVIPVGAGLAGGSSDAAATLRALNKIHNYPLGSKKLAEIALKIGADVPYCLIGGTRLASGVGEKLSPLPRLPECFILLVKPGFSISTKWAYGEFDNLKEVFHPDTDALVAALRRSDLYGICEHMGNSLEGVATASYPVLSEIKGRLFDLGALASQMSGSGPTMFGIFDDEKTARAAKNSLSGDYKTVFLCRRV